MNKEIINQPRAIVHSLLFGLSGTPLSNGAPLFISIMKTISLTQGKVALVDDEDFEYLNQWNWQAHKDKNTFYAVRTKYEKISKGNWVSRGISMHREILRTPKGIKVDHIDHDGLNNQKYNLRNCTNQQNCFNSSPCGRSKYLGVDYAASGTIIQARICFNRKSIYLGSFKTEEAAARAYDVAAKKYFGEFANLNFKE